MKIRGQTVIPIADRLMSFVEKDVSGCWNWRGAVQSKKRPYGRLVIGSRTDGTRKNIGAHRLSFLIFKGIIPAGMEVCHTCDNPRCINPDHLFVGSRQDNVDDRERKGRNSIPPTARNEQASWSKFSDALILEIKAPPLSSRAASTYYGVTDSYVRQIRRGVWRKPAPPAATSQPGDA